MKLKRGQSQIIATVLLILLVLTSVFIIMGTVIPFVKNQLSKTECINVIDKIEIKNNPDYTYYDYTSKELSVQVHLGDVLDKIEGVVLVIEGDSSESFEIKEGINDNRIKMSTGQYNQQLSLPSKNTERTYKFKDINEKPKSISGYLKLKNGETCKASDTLTYISDKID